MENDIQPQSREEHYEKVKNGICPLCGSTKGFEYMTFGDGTEFECAGTFCKECDLEIY